jgi:hypothetical protein
MLLSRESLLAKTGLRLHRIDFPADCPVTALAGQHVFVRAMSAGERGRFETQFYDSKKGKVSTERTAEVRERLLIATLCDEAGKPLLTARDLDALKEIDSAVVEFLNSAATQHNRFSESDIEDIAKNSETTNGGSLASA